MDIQSMKMIGVAATVGAVAMLCASVAQATSCTFSCTHDVPEPATLGLLGLGLAGAAIARWRK